MLITKAGSLASANYLSLAPANTIPFYQYEYAKLAQSQGNATMGGDFMFKKVH